MIDTSHKGWICLDIDGTVTDDIQTIPQAILDYLCELHQKNWKIAFVTGRLFEMAIAPLKHFPVPYFLAVQNGASWYEMPGSVLRSHKYIPKTILFDLLPLLNEVGLDLVIATGYEEGGYCYYRPTHLNPNTTEYFQTTLSKEGGNWRSIPSFDLLEENAFPYAKVYGDKQELQTIQNKISSVEAIKTHLVQDSINPNNMILQIMRKDVDKGKIVLEMLKNAVLPGPIISAGNDLNDETLLSIANVKIAMENSPQSLLDLADIIAPPVEEMGLLPALKKAVQLVEEK